MKLDVGTASGSGVISDTNDAVLTIEFHARSENKHSVYVGLSDVSETNGRELPPGEFTTWNFALPDTGRSSGSVLFSKIYASIRSGDLLDYVAIIRSASE